VVIALFAYGTLRVGEPNFHWVERHLEYMPVPGCLADGQLFHVWGDHAGFPVARFDLPGTVWGDLLFMESTSEVFREIAWMEEGAGYLLRQVPVLTPNNEVVEALGWHYPRPAGARISSGDWLTEARKKLVRR
jgi:gamma-glutamylcyclotransferase (GGCT)/AIG2-like uncharacterized protein YtfP